MNNQISPSFENFIEPGLAEQQARIFLEDAEEYRSINHRIDEKGLKLYKVLYSTWWQATLFVSIVFLLLLAFLEFPSSLTLSGEIDGVRTEVPISMTLGLESLFLVIIGVDALMLMFVFGPRNLRGNPWLILSFVLLAISFIDLLVSVGLDEAYFFRLRRFFRPLFAIQKSQLMKKVLKSLSKTVTDIVSAFLLLAIWLLAFTLISVSIFYGFGEEILDTNYASFYNALFTLLVLLTTANNPDAMIKVYNKNRLSFVFFVVFMSVGIFVFMNVLIAIVFNEFRNHVLDSMQTSLFRRRVATRAVYEVLRGGVNKLEALYQEEIDIDTVKSVIDKSNICRWRRDQMNKAIESLAMDRVDWQSIKFILAPLDDHKESKMVLLVPKYENPRLIRLQKFILSRIFEIIGLAVCFLNILVIGVDVSNKFDRDTPAARSLEIFNWIFIVLYVIEQSSKFMSMGARIYFSRRGCLLEFIVTLIILTMKIVEAGVMASSRTSFFGFISVWDLPRITNLLILARTARIALLFPSLTPIINTLFDIPWRMKSVIGLVCLTFYLYALVGMNVFGGQINSNFMVKSNNCGSYQQLDYGGINFNDFYSSIVVLWCLLIVNNWHVFMDAFASAMNDNKWTHLYMITWWILAVIVLLNCVTAFVIEAYSQRKAYYDEERSKRLRRKSVKIDVIAESIEYLRSPVVVNNSFTFQMLFKNDLIEPTDDELMSSLKKCEFLCKRYPHIAHSHYDC